MRNGLVDDKDGNKVYYKEGRPHREDGPALELAAGTTMWYRDGQYHREDGPSIVWPNGETSWHLKGERLGDNEGGFWNLWDRLTVEQRGSPTLLKYLPR